MIPKLSIIFYEGTERFESDLILRLVDFLLSPVVDFEIRRYLLLKQATRNLRQYEALVESWVKLELNHSDWEQAAVWWAELHKKGYSIADADLLIAVHAFANQATLVTKNLRHFEYLDLILIDWTV